MVDFPLSCSYLANGLTVKLFGITYLVLETKVQLLFQGPLASEC